MISRPCRDSGGSSRLEPGHFGNARIGEVEAAVRSFCEGVRPAQSRFVHEHGEAVTVPHLDGVLFDGGDVKLSIAGDVKTVGRSVFEESFHAGRDSVG